MQWFSYSPVTIRRETARIEGRTFMMCPCDSVNKSFVDVCEEEEGEEWQNIVLSSICVWRGWGKGLGYEHRAVRNKLNLFFVAAQLQIGVGHTGFFGVHPSARFRPALVLWAFPVELDFFTFEVDLVWQCTMSLILLQHLCVSQNTTTLIHSDVVF